MFALSLAPFSSIIYLEPLINVISVATRHHDGIGRMPLTAKAKDTVAAKSADDIQISSQWAWLHDELGMTSQTI